MCILTFPVCVLEFFDKCTKDSSKQRDYRAYTIYIHIQIYFDQMLVKTGRTLVRFLCKIGQIVSKMLEKFCQILIISTLVRVSTPFLNQDTPQSNLKVLKYKMGD